MRKILFAILIPCAILAGCQDKQNKGTYPAELIGSWSHSYEEDTQNLKVFRPAAYEFPPAFSREGFELMEGGQCIYHGIAPADGVTNEEASWAWGEGNRLVITRKADGAPEIVLDVESVSKDMLKVKQ